MYFLSAHEMMCVVTGMSGQDDFMGEHTLIPLLTRSPQAYAGTPLEISQGKLPPYIVVCGARERVESTARHMSSVLYLDRHMEECKLSRGRVCLLYKCIEYVCIVYLLILYCKLHSYAKEY